jgi:hypothetical protein
MFHSLKQCIGHRNTSPNTMRDEVVLCEWSHPIYNPSSHLGLKIHKDGHDYYFSFSPKNTYDIAHIPFARLRMGLPGFIVRQFKDETLLWGFRNAWGRGLQQKLSHEQINQLNAYYEANHPGTSLTSNKLSQEVIDDFAHLRDSQLLEVARKFDKPLKSQLRALGQPNGGETVLRTLDIQAILDKISDFVSNTPQWAPWAGTYLHHENTYNCASIVLTLLYAGGMGKLINSRANEYAVAGTLLGLLSLTVSYDPILLAESMAVGLGGGCVLGAAVDSYHDIQHFFNMIAGSPEDNPGTLFGMRLVSVLCGGLIGAVKQGPFLPAFLCLPRNVVELARQAEQNEKNTHRFNLPEHECKAPAYTM